LDQFISEAYKLSIASCRPALNLQAFHNICNWQSRELVSF